MEHIIEDFEQQKNRIESNIDYIKQNLDKSGGPIFVELMGTPKSGKTTLLGAFKNLFGKYGIRIQAKQETAEYNPIQDKSSEEYSMWMIMELMKELSEDFSDGTPRIVIYDRGMLDRIPWLDCSVKDGTIPARDSELLKGVYQTEFMRKYRPLSYGMVTSPELSVKRKGKPGRTVNYDSIALFNDCFEKEFEFINGLSQKLSITTTDPYQGSLNEFIMDVSETVTRDVSEIIRERIPEVEEASRKYQNVDR